MGSTTAQAGRAGLLRALGIQALLALLVTFTAIGVAQAPASAHPSAALPAVHAVAAAGVADTAKDSTAVDPLASWTCSWVRSGNNVASNCTVYSGYLRQWAYCSGWGYIYTPWVGSGSWVLRTNCNSYTLTSWGYQSTG